jgi:DNA primase
VEFSTRAGLVSAGWETVRMSLPPRFLDELRARVSLADIVQRRVRLTKRGREYTGLCPFHNEKSPSFTVSEEKGFFHCFGCGAHGDAIGFVMRSGNLTFPEAVESLAAEAGLDVPRATPQERERAQRQVGLHAVLEAACVYFEAQLRTAAGRPALDYLRARGLDDETIQRWRLGFAPESRQMLRQTLSKSFPEEALIEAGLVKSPESEPGERVREPFDYFRNRVMFPIGDRAGRVIAFGGRVMGDGQPKYLNSPDTPLFHKGRVLFGASAARGAILKGGTESAPIVTEGYMDVIALHRAGFTTAVAPLGTALTEQQLAELWKLAPEPVLCFDGDAAGARAAARALDRAMPLLQSGRSLRFATVPAGEDPDSLIRKFGASAMADVLKAARPFAEAVWTIEHGAVPPDTPERRADLQNRLDERAARITDRRVRDEYVRYFRDRFFRMVRPPPRAAGPGNRTGNRAGNRKGWTPSTLDDMQLPRGQLDKGSTRRRQEVLVGIFLHFPELLDELVEDFAELDLPAADLDALRRGILNLHTVHPDLDAAMLQFHLTESGLGHLVTEFCKRPMPIHLAVAIGNTDRERARGSWCHARDLYRQEGMLRAGLDEAVRDLGSDPTDQSWSEFLARHKSARDQSTRSSRIGDGFDDDTPPE